MKIIDFHSHIVPGIDDGSRDVNTSIEMLKEMSRQGVDMAVLTPHFYAENSSIDKYLEQRAHAYEKLKTAIFAEISQTPETTFPEIKLGAEVAYFEGISKAEKIDALLIEGTNMMLLEMPFEAWNDKIISEVEDLINKRGFTIIIAHLERFVKILGNKKYVKKLLELPVIIQVNVGPLLVGDKKTVLKLLKNGQAHVLGSDAHGIHGRKPNLGLGRDFIKNALGEEILEKIDRAGNELFK